MALIRFYRFYRAWGFGPLQAFKAALRKLRVSYGGTL